MPGPQRCDRVEEQIGPLLAREPAREPDDRSAFRRELATQRGRRRRVGRGDRDRRRDHGDLVAPRREPGAVRGVVVRIRDERVGAPRRVPPSGQRRALDQAIEHAGRKVQVAVVRHDQPRSGARSDRAPQRELGHRRVRPDDVGPAREPPRGDRIGGHQRAAAHPERRAEPQDVDAGDRLARREVRAVARGDHGDAMAAHGERLGDALHVQRVAGPVRQVVLERRDDRERLHRARVPCGRRTIDV